MAPVIRRAASEARKRTAVAIDEDVPSRPIGMLQSQIPKVTGSVFGEEAFIGVSMKPGATAFTRTPFGAHSAASAPRDAPPH